MITQIRIAKTSGTYMQLDLTSPDDGYLVTDISGLEPGKATMVSTTFANAPGAQYQTSRREVRNIVFTIGLRPGYASTVDELRSNLYSYFMPQSTVTLTFYTTALEPVKITGVVESFEYSRFSKSPTASISIMCYDPDFLALAPTSVEGKTKVLAPIIDYKGTVETGVVAKLSLEYNSTPTLAVTITNNYQNGSQNFNFRYYTDLPYGVGSYLQINTNRFNKTVDLQIRSTLRSAVAYVQPFSDWIQLKPGPNRLMTVLATPGLDIKFTYTNRYGGI